MRPLGHAKATVLQCRVFERIPERHRARWVAEADGSVLVWDEVAPDAGEFGDELALRDAWVAVTQGLRHGAVECRKGQRTKGGKLLVDAEPKTGNAPFKDVGGRFIFCCWALLTARSC